MNNELGSAPMTELQLPTAMFDSGDDMVREVAKGAVNNMIATGGVLVVFNKRVLGALFQNVRRRSLVLVKQGKEPMKLWTHRTHGPGGEFREGRWMVKIRQEGETINPFYGGEGEHRNYGFWLAQANQLIEGKEIEVASTYEFQRLGQSFRLACDRKGYQREGRVLRRRANDNGTFTAYLAKPLRLKAEVTDGKSVAAPEKKKVGRKSAGKMTKTSKRAKA